MNKITHKELAEDLENVLFDLTNGEVYEAMKYLGDIITELKKENDNDWCNVWIIIYDWNSNACNLLCRDTDFSLQIHRSS